MHILDFFNYELNNGDKLETRICGILMRNNISTVEILRNTSDKDLLKLRGLGESSLEYIHQRLKELEE